MSHWTIDQSIFSTIDWHYTMAYFLASLLKTHIPLSTCVAMMCVRFIYERRLYATMVYLATLNSNYSVVYGQKHKVWLLVFLVRMSGTFLDQNWADLVKFSVLQQNRIVYSNSIQGTLLSISSNGLGNKTFISCLFLVKSKLLPLGTVDDLMHYCTRPSALCNSASGRPWHLFVVHGTTNRHGITV